MSDRVCHFCNEMIPLMELGFHTLICLRELSIRKGRNPLCSCNYCQGRITHPGDTLECVINEDGTTTWIPHSSYSPLSFTTPPSPIARPTSPGPPIKKQKAEPASVAPAAPAVPAPPATLAAAPAAPTAPAHMSLLTPDQLKGKTCFVCSLQKSPSAVPIPFIYLGNYRTLMVCKKSHFSRDDEYATMLDRLQLEYNTVVASCDQPASAHKRKGALPSAPNKDKLCGGLDDIEKPKEVCQEPCYPYIFITPQSSGDYTFFCSPVHALHYLHVHFLKRGDKVVNKHRESSSKEARKDNNREQGNNDDV